ncbi:MAG: hypothetical protein GC160_02280 [Acidobacteria bacterium]|nr:hypothetical protein [Acidobacteriota bacterium]
MALWLCLGLLPTAELLAAATSSQSVCEHGHTRCKCPEMCKRPAPQPAPEPNAAGMEGMACHRNAAAKTTEPAAPKGPCLRSCSSEEEEAQAAPLAQYLSAGDLVASAHLTNPERARPGAEEDPLSPPSARIAPPPRRG